jgi:hypothetical protein
MNEPFGQADCESEVRSLKADYRELYFDETPFNEAALKSETYLIIGRRGSGKTALSHYFSFKKAFDDPIYIDVDEPALYQKFLSELAAQAGESRELAIYRLQRIWSYVVWTVILEHTRGLSADIERACEPKRPRRSVSEFINGLLQTLVEVFRDGDGDIGDVDLEGLFTSPMIKQAREAVLALARRRPVVMAIDTLERYDVSDQRLMNAMAALVQCAAEFNSEFAERGIHLKVFMSGEVFPHLTEVVLQNPLKSVKNPVYLLWRPKDLLRLICWRFHRYLEATGQLDARSEGPIDWVDHDQVLRRMWLPYFGDEITNGRGLRERTFSYVLRHTQLRPRQLILVCNAIANRAGSRFPHFSEPDIREAVKQAESDLASEIINSFHSVYPRVHDIVDALMNMPMVFAGNELDKRAPLSKTAWSDASYSPAAFRQLVAELGIVGRVSRNNLKDGFIDADFEYSLRDRLRVTHRDQCVIHPMFYKRLNVDINARARIMPFSTDRDSRDVIG